MLLQVPSMIYLVGAILLFVWLGQVIARKRGLNPVFWGVMGALFGPLMLLFIFFAKPAAQDPSCSD